MENQEMITRIMQNLKNTEGENLEGSLLNTVVYKLSKNVDPSEIIFWLLSVISKQQTVMSSCMFARVG